MKRKLFQTDIQDKNILENEMTIKKKKFKHVPKINDTNWDFNKESHINHYNNIKMNLQKTNFECTRKRNKFIQLMIYSLNGNIINLVVEEKYTIYQLKEILYEKYCG
jgi:hypothetical protein